MRTNVATIALACLGLWACDRNEPPEVAEPPSAEPVEAARAPAPVAEAPAPAEPEVPAPAPAEPEMPAPSDEDAALAQIEPELEIPPIPLPPEDYGLLALPQPVPAEDELVIHALAGYEVVAVYAEPNIDAPKLGYLRLGTRMKVTKKQGTKGCAKGWYGLPNGGFACASKGLVVDAKRAPYMHRPPPPPRMEQSFPYRYAYVRRWNSPMWWRIPTADERTEADTQRAVREAVREGKPPPGSEPAAAPAKPESKPATADPAEAKDPKKAEPTDGLPSVTDDAAKAVAAKTKPAAEAKPAEAKEAKPAEPVAVAQAEPAAEEPPPIKLPLSPDTPWLEKGFFISLADKVTEDGKTWWHTARGAYVDAGAAYEYEAKDFSGVALGEESGFPFGYAMVKEAKVYDLDEEGKLKVTGKLERRTFVDLSEEIEVGGKAYMMTTEGSLLRKKDLRLAEPQPLPEGIEPWERWVDVSLSKQMLVAYEGTRPVYVTLVSSGRKGTKEEPFDTPTGRFRIRSKHVSSTMDGPTLSDGNYSIQDVPWAMFFKDSYALHGAFWHNSFGRVRSHGCVNLGATDAKWLFEWTTPFLPEGWHGVHAHEGSPGSTVIVRE